VGIVEQDSFTRAIAAFSVVAQAELPTIAAVESACFRVDAARGDRIGAALNPVATAGLVTPSAMILRTQLRTMIATAAHLPWVATVGDFATEDAKRPVTRSLALFADELAVVPVRRIVS
jgi:hypothetical protein